MLSKKEAAELRELFNAALANHGTAQIRAGNPYIVNVDIEAAFLCADAARAAFERRLAELTEG